ncbi:MAG: chemotaxis-specific protein-glutamate methyltransferase CheB [Myxococcaceae bacterium]|nr:chemotaxis-specific protein-glutamate methyltransferase CheB [Myxococcaceae bacterium]
MLVVDDSAFARKVLREVLSRVPELELVGFARDGLEALERIAELKPDVVCLDLVMPELDGVGLLRELKNLPDRPHVVVVSFSDHDSEAVIEALALGAFDVVKKPTALATDRMYELAAPLTKVVLEAVAARPVRAPAPVAESAALALDARLATTRSLLAIGTSTGGPQALATLMPRLPANFPLPVVIALHIPGEYTGALAARLASASKLAVVEATDGIELVPGVAVLARGGQHLVIERQGERLGARVTRAPRDTLYHPSVNVLFGSAAKACGRGVIGVVLTGMGDDGLEGSRAVVEAGGVVLNEAESSCVVYGMPRAVKEAGLSQGSAPLERMAEVILRQL